MKKSLDRIRVYFNRCFTDTSEIIKELKNNTDGIDYDIYISHPVRNMRLEECSNYYEIESSFEKSEDYADYCLDFCTKHKIDVFIPRFRAAELAAYSEKFSTLGIKVMFIGESQLYEFIDNKAEVYEDLKDSSIIKIPPYKMITNYNEFLEGYEYIKSEGFKVCIKPVSGIGAEGFKVIKEGTSLVDELKFSSFQISYERICEILRSVDSVEPILMSGFLPGDEWSIDCLADKGKLIDAVTRIKYNKFEQNVKINETANNIAAQLVNRYNLDNLFNIQFKLKDDEIYLLEINSRMSAGTFKSCRIGINFLHKAIKKLYGCKVETETYKYHDIKVRTENIYEIYDGENNKL